MHRSSTRSGHVSGDRQVDKKLGVHAYHLSQLADWSSQLVNRKQSILYWHLQKLTTYKANPTNAQCCCNLCTF